MRHTLAIAIAIVVALVWSAPAGRAQQAKVQASPKAVSVPPLDAGVTPLTAQNIEGHRLWLILFDKTSMKIADIERAAAYADTWVSNKTPNVDVVAIAVISVDGLEVRQDFTSDTAKIRKAVAWFGKTVSDAGTMSNDARALGLRRICEVLQDWPQPKHILALSSGVVLGDPFYYRQAADACDKAKATVESLDARGLVGRGRGNSSPLAVQRVSLVERRPY